MNPETRFRVGLAVVSGGIALSVLHHARHAVRFADSRPAVAATFILSLLAVGAALWLWRVIESTNVSKDVLGRAAVWYLAGGILFFVAVPVSIAATYSRAVLTPAVWFSVGNWGIAGSALGLVFANYDLRRVEALERARANERRAIQLSQRLSVLNRVLRHDVRNKLNVILGYARDSGGDGIDETGAAAIGDAAESLLTIVERVRRLRTLLEQESPTPQDLTEQVSTLAKSLRSEYPAATVDVLELQAVTARTYPEFRRVLEELLRNAIEHNPNPESACLVEVSLRSVDSDEGPIAEVVIADNGPGIPERERLVQSDDLETQLNHSLGTSLWLTRWIVDASDGEFAIEETGPGGTRLRIRLPETGAD